MALIIVILIVVVRAFFEVFFGGTSIEGTTVFLIEQSLHEIVLLAGLEL